MIHRSFLWRFECREFSVRLRHRIFWLWIWPRASLGPCVFIALKFWRRLLLVPQPWGSLQRVTTHRGIRGKPTRPVGL